MNSVRERIHQSLPTVTEGSPQELLSAIKSLLTRAHYDDRLQTPQHGIHNAVKLRNTGRSTFAIVGGSKDYRRDPNSAQLIRDDNSWFHFAITGEHSRGSGVTLASYEFEIVFAPGHSPAFVRFDFITPELERERNELRSHLHPGHEDYRCPCPVMTPSELLALLLNEFRLRTPAISKSVV